ncbi:MAG: GMC oxidoreductase [Gammaproteobacteria bacterium]
MAIVGSGVAAITVAYLLTRKGHDVVLFEKGPDYPYPHARQFEERVKYLYINPTYQLASDIRRVTWSGDYRQDLDHERGMVVGGSATHWLGITLRMHPTDFRTRTAYGFGFDWPITYDMLEPYYCKAESLLSVSGTDADNPFAPPRTHPYPLPPFDLTPSDRVLAARLQKADITLHTTPQARTRLARDGRPACQNFGTCGVCPIGARYSPNHHLARAQATGLCRVISNASVRRITTDRTGRARAVLYRNNETTTDLEHAAKVVVVAAGAIESARLLLLSADAQNPNGLRNQSAHVGKNLVFHHLWHASLRYREKVHAGRLGAVTGQCHQFCDVPERGRHGGIKVEFSSHYAGLGHGILEQRSAARETSGGGVVETFSSTPHLRGLILHAESAPNSSKYVGLSEKRDRFGDPFAHVHYESAAFDEATYSFAKRLCERFAMATNGEIVDLEKIGQYSSGAHHMGSCRMGRSDRESVVDSFGKLHGCPNLYLVGSSVFAGSSGAVNPTLTLVALTIRTSEHILSRVL